MREACEECGSEECGNKEGVCRYCGHITMGEAKEGVCWEFYPAECEECGNTALVPRLPEKVKDDHYLGYADEIPERTIGALRRYCMEFIEPGDFLMSVLEDKLLGAMTHGDIENVEALPAIVTYVYNELPADSWGDEESVRRWLAKGNNERLHHTHRVPQGGIV